MKKFLIFNVILFFAALTQTLTAATITTLIDRNVVGLNESFNIIFEATGSTDDPDFSPLRKDFEIQGQSSSSNISIINGAYKKSKKWTVSVYAKRAGELTVPSILFGKDKSPALKITVKQASQHSTAQRGDIFLEAELSPKTAWAQSQIILTLRFMSSKNLSSFGGFSKLEIENMDVVIEQLGEDKQYQTTIANKPYLVIERSYAIFPQQSGLLRINPIIAEARITSGSRSIFDPFQRSGKTRRVRSKALEITIKGVPANYHAKHWLPAAEIQLIEEWPQNPPIFKAGEPVTRTLTIMADGLTSAQLPELLPAAVKDLKQYPDQAVLKDNKKNNGIIGIRQEKIALIPTRAGQFTLPAIEILWFNTSTGKIENARIKKRIITVAAGDLITPDPQMTAKQPDDISSQPTSIILNAPSTQSNGIWFWLSLFFGTAWLFTLITWWYKHRNIKSNARSTEGYKNTLSISAANKALKKACDKNDAQACKDVLLDWGKAIYPATPPANLGDLSKLTGGRLESLINELNQALYSLDAQEWKSRDLWSSCQNILADRHVKKTQFANDLEPLYKI